MDTNRIYRIVKDDPTTHLKPWCVEVLGRGFWQQVSPWYMYQSGANNFCKRNNIHPTKVIYLNK